MHFWCARRHQSESVINKEYSVCKTIGEYRYYLYQSRGAALHWYLSDRELDGFSCRSWSTSVQSSFLEMFWHLLSPLYRQTAGYKATKFDDYEDCVTTLWRRLEIWRESPAETSTSTVVNMVWHECWGVNKVCQCQYVIFSLKMLDCLLDKSVVSTIIIQNDKSSEKS